MSADFTPEKEDYKILTPFKMQVLTNFPYIEADFDALTNYQLLCKVVEYLNNVIANENEVTEQVTSLYNAYVSLQTYVNTYFDNLDLNEEVSVKLDEMAEDGTLTNLISSYIGPIFDDYKNDLDEDITEYKNSINNTVGEINTKVNSIYNQSPIPVSSTDDMTDTTKVYVLLTTGDWYYYNGSAWTVGGEYVADIEGLVKIEGREEVYPKNIIGSTRDTYTVSNDIFSTLELKEEGKYAYVNTFGNLTWGTNANINTYLYEVKEYPNILMFGTNQMARFAVAVEDDMTTVVGDAFENAYSIEVPEGAAYIYLSINVDTYPNPSLKELTYDYIMGDKFKIDDYNIVNTLTSGKNKSNNLLGKSILVEDGKYMGTSTLTHKITWNVDTDRETRKIKVNKGDTVYCSQIRSGCLVNLDDTTWITTLADYPTSLEITNDGYYYFSINKNKINVAEISVERGYNLSSDTYSIKPSYDAFKKVVIKSGEHSASIRLYNNVSDNFVVIAKTFFSTFYDTYIRFASIDNVVSNYITVTSSKLIINNTYQAPAEYDHGLTIENDLFIKLERLNGKAYVTLSSSGEDYSIEVDYYTLTSVPTYTLLVINDAGNTTTGSLTITMRNLHKELWLIGDSYMGMNSNARWCYYLVENNENNNIFISNAPGATSANAYTSLQNLLTMYRPKKVLIATGMNDGSDSGSASSAYTTNMTNIINLLKSYDIEIILGTIPSVPSINNEYKNAFVRSSGYRYVDFAKAVGAQSDGTWNTGMLSTDNVHPTAKGAKALYNQALTDLPELMY